MKKIRTLLPSDIELRVADKNTKGQVHMLMYITSRSATDLLDETYGMENYNIEYVDVAGQIYCKLSVWDEEHQRYVVRMDTGEEAKIAADKSLASDALKRVIVRLGVTELYSGPAVYIDDDGYGNKGYKVSEIAYDDKRNITHLVIVNKFGKEAFRWDLNAPTYQPYHPDSINRSMAPQMSNTDILRTFCTKKKTEVGTNIPQLKQFFDYWDKRINDGKFNGVIKPEVLWQTWITR